MLKFIVPGVEHYDDESQLFVTIGDTELDLEHSLVSLSKWESIYEVPFLGTADKTTEQVFKYIECMTLTPNVPSEVFKNLTDANITEINKYIDAKMSATWFNEPPGAPRSRDVITAELIYYWMVVFEIPFECQHWHLNKLFTLIRVCNIKQAKPEKMSRAETLSRNRELNEQRKKQLGTKG